MTSEAYSSAGRAAGRYARVLLGRTAGTSLGLGLAGAVGSTVLYEAALTPLGSHDKLKGFHESTLNVYSLAAGAFCHSPRVEGRRPTLRASSS